MFINSEEKETPVLYILWRIKRRKIIMTRPCIRLMGTIKCLSAYEYLKNNAEWIGRYEDFLKGKRSLPLLYDPFFKKIFNPVEREDRLSELVSCLLGQKVTVL